MAILPNQSLNWKHIFTVMLLVIILTIFCVLSGGLRPTDDSFDPFEVYGKVLRAQDQ
jgi:hypothetical protein